jgi:hypothetical protein
MSIVTAAEGGRIKPSPFAALKTIGQRVTAPVGQEEFFQ